MSSGLHWLVRLSPARAGGVSVLEECVPELPFLSTAFLADICESLRSNCSPFGVGCMLTVVTCGVYTS